MMRVILPREFLSLPVSRRSWASLLCGVFVDERPLCFLFLTSSSRACQYLTNSRRRQCYLIIDGRVRLRLFVSWSNGDDGGRASGIVTQAVVLTLRSAGSLRPYSAPTWKVQWKGSTSSLLIISSSVDQKVLVLQRFFGDARYLGTFEVRRSSETTHGDGHRRLHDHLAVHVRRKTHLDASTQAKDTYLLGGLCDNAEIKLFLIGEELSRNSLVNAMFLSSTSQ